MELVHRLVDALPCQCNRLCIHPVLVEYLIQCHIDFMDTYILILILFLSLSLSLSLSYQFLIGQERSSTCQMFLQVLLKALHLFYQQERIQDLRERERDDEMRGKMSELTYLNLSPKECSCCHNNTRTRDHLPRA